MFKKITSTAAAVLLMAAGLSIAGATSANAVNTDATINLASTIKGATISSVGVPNRNRVAAVAGSICLTSAQAADTSGADLTSITGNAADAFVPIQTKYTDLSSFSANGMGGSTITSTTTFSQGNIIAIVVDSGPGPMPGATFFWYALNVSIDSCPSLSSPSVSGPTAEQIAAVQAAIAAAIVKAKTTLHGALKGDKAGTLAQYRDADYSVNNEKVVEKVNAAVLKLPLADRENVEKIKAVIKIENFVDLISTAATQPKVNSASVVAAGLLAKDNPYKTSVVRGLLSRDPATLNTIEKIQEAVAAELAVVKARVDRLAAIKAKIAARKK